MKKKLLCAILVLSFCSSYSQGEANIWYFGRNAGLNFNNGGAVPLTDGQINTEEGCAAISDGNGQLLFYTDGEKVWNRNHQVMPNGTGLLGNFSTTQSAVIVPSPASSLRYFIFTCTDKDHNDGVRYSEVDLSLNGGLGDVTAMKNILLLNPTCEKLTAVKNQAGDGYWVMAREFGNDKFHAYSVTAAGVNPNSVVSSLGYFNPNSFAGKSGSLKFSPDGTKLVNATVSLGAPFGLSTVELFDFNAATGQVSNLKTVSNRISNYGVEFSPSGNLLYATTGDFWTTELAVYNLTALDIPSTEMILNTFPNGGYPTYGTLQLGPDNKIYVAADYGAPFTNHTIGVINTPETYGLGCNYQVQGVNLGSAATSAYGLPQFVQSYFIASFTAENLCLGSITEFTLNTSGTPLSVSWDFGDGFFSNDLNPAHQYLLAGDYDVEVTVNYGAGAITKSKQITIFGTPVIANTVSVSPICGAIGQPYDLSQLNPVLLGSQPAGIYTVAYFGSLPDAENHNAVLSSNQILQPGANIFYAKVYNALNTSCHAITSFSIALNEQPVAHFPSSFIICEIPYDGVAIFDLSLKNQEVLMGQSVSQFSITYHSDLTDAQNDSNPLPNLYTNTLSHETLFVRIENNSDASCYSTTTLEIEVIQQPQINAVTDFVICDDLTNDGIAGFDLTQKTAEILNGQSAAVFVVKYFYNLTDAQNNAGEITSVINNTVNNQEIYYSIAAIGNPDCKAVSSFNLVVSPMPIINTANDIYTCDDDSNDGLGIFDLGNNTAHIIGNPNASQFTVTYHLNQNDADLGINPLALNYQNTSNPQMIYARMQNNQNQACYATTTFQIGLNVMPKAFTASHLYLCDDGADGVEQFDLAQQTATVLGLQSLTDFEVSYHTSLTDASAGVNALNTGFTNTVNPQMIFARIENRLNPLCFATTSFVLHVKARPDLNLEDDYTICEGQPISIQAASGLTSYNWSNGSTSSSAHMATAGNYSVTGVKDYGTIACSATKNFAVNQSNIATITRIVARDWTDNRNTITVEVSGAGDYEYSLDGINYQDSNVFTGLESGAYTVFVNDRKGCGTVSKDVFLLMYPKFFTPNGDGINDHWHIKYAFKEPDMEIRIFDRYGKFIKVFRGVDFGWDGTLNGHLLFSDDYWFVVKRQDGKEFKGHFALKR